MRFAIDAQLARRMVGWIGAHGGDAIHTLDLPAANLTADAELVRVADQDGRIVVTKDDDFVVSHILSGSPRKLLLISTGNISNRRLEALFVAALQASSASSHQTSSSNWGTRALSFGGRTRRSTPTAGGFPPTVTAGSCYPR